MITLTHVVVRDVIHFG